MGEITVTGADDRANLRQFIEFPYRHYRSDPYWVPPLRIAQRDLLDRKKHPFYQHAEMQLFLALRGSDVVGRVAAILDRSQFECIEGLLRSVSIADTGQNDAFCAVRNSVLNRNGVHVGVRVYDLDTG